MQSWVLLVLGLQCIVIALGGVVLLVGSSPVSCVLCPVCGGCVRKVLGTRHYRAHTVDTPGVVSSVERSSISIGHRSSSDSLGSGSSRIGHLNWSSRLSRSSNILDSSIVRISSIGVSSIGYGSSSVGHWSSNGFHMDIRFSSNLLMDIWLGSNLSCLNWLLMNISLSSYFFMNIWLGSNFLVDVRLSSNFSCLYRLFMNIWLGSYFLMNIWKSNWSNIPLLWSRGSKSCRDNGQQNKE